MPGRTASPPLPPVRSVPSKAAGPAPAPPRTAWAARLESPLAAYYLVLGSTIALVGHRPRHGAVQLERGVAQAAALLVHDLRQAGHVRGGRAAAGVDRRAAARQGLEGPRLALAARRVRGAGARDRRSGTPSRATRTGSRIAGFTLQPSEAVKLALVVWVAAVLERKRPLFHQTVHAARSRACRSSVLLLAPRAGRPRPGHRAGPHGAWSAPCCSSPARRCGSSPSAARWRPPPCSLLVTTSANRMDRLAHWSGKAQRPPGHRLAAPARHCGRWPPAAGGGSAWGTAGRSGHGCPRPTTTSSSRSSARSWACSARSPSSRSSRCSPSGCSGSCWPPTTSS